MPLGLDEAVATVHWRLEAAEMAERYVAYLELPLPGGLMLRILRPDGSSTALKLIRVSFTRKLKQDSDTHHPCQRYFHVHHLRLAVTKSTLRNRRTI